MDERRLTLSADQPSRLGPLGIETRLHADASLLDFEPSDSTSHMMSRFSLSGTLEKPVGKTRLVARTFAAWVAGGDDIPSQHRVYIGGATTAPGYRFHQFAGRAALSQRIEAQFPVRFASIPLGRYGRTPATLTLAPFINAAWVDRVASVRNSGDELSLIAPETNGWHPSVGVGAMTLFDLLRFDVSKGLRDGRWSFSVDVSRDFWGIL
jgi:hypothetical protein